MVAAEAVDRRRRPAGTQLSALVVGGTLGVVSAVSAGQFLLLVCAVAAVLGLWSGTNVRFWPRGSDIVGSALVSVPVAALVAGVAARSSEALALGLVRGAAVAAGACLPALIVSAVRQRRAHVDRGWVVAQAAASEQDALVREAVLGERQRMAGEIHDGLGHRLTLLAVQAARLSLDETLPATVRHELGTMRAAAARASDDLGRTVSLLSKPHGGGEYSYGAGTLADVIENARMSGLAVTVTVNLDLALELELELELERRLGDYPRAALLRAVQEGLTNAAKHAPNQPVLIDVTLLPPDLTMEHGTASHQMMDDEAADHLAMSRSVRGGELTLTISNPVSARASRSRSGHGLSALRHRAEILGGSLEITSNERFQLRLVLPAHAVPVGSRWPLGGRRGADEIRAEQTRSNRNRRRAARLSLTVPALLAVAGSLAAGGYFTYATLTSVLSPDSFGRIEIGRRQQSVESLLPWTQMLDAPRSAADEAEGDCHYYESSISFFERDEVYRICFLSGVVGSTRTIPAP